MAFTGITATEAEIDQKTGANVSASYTDVMKTQALLQAECTLNCATRYNWSDAYAGLNVDVKYIITDVTASLVAIEAIKYDLYSTGLSVGESMINVLRDAALRGISILKLKEVQTFMLAA